MAGPQTSNPSKEIDKPATNQREDMSGRMKRKAWRADMREQQDQEGSGFRKILKELIVAKL